jgi:hypothetical protein
MAKQTQDLRAIRPSDAVAVLRRCMQVGRPAMLWGPPGIGKSDIIAQIGAKENRPVIDLRLLLMEPTDIKGIPYYDPASCTMEWAKPSELPGIVSEEEIAHAEAALENARAQLDDNDATFTSAQVEAMVRNVRVLRGSLALQNAILFLDEINAAPQSVQAAAYQLILNRKVGTYHLPDGVSIVAAGNRETDKAVTFRMPSALANRFIHFEMAVNFEDWEDWAIRNRISSDVIGFLKAKQNYLFMFDPKSGDKAFATPRSWAFVSQLLDDSMSESLNSVMVQGTVGTGVAHEFMQHRRLKGKLPNPREILEGKVTELPPNKEVDASAKYSLMVAMCYVLEQMQEEYNNDDKKTAKDWSKVTDTFLEFIMGSTKGEAHFQAEMVIMGAVVALRKYDIEFDSDTKTFGKFFDKYHKWIVNTD